MHLHLQNVMIAAAISFMGCPAVAQGLEGHWVVDQAQSVDNDPWRQFEVTILLHGDSVSIDRFWRGTSRYTQRDSISVPLDKTVEIAARPGKWMNQVYLGVFVPPNRNRAVTATLSDDADSLTVTTTMPLMTSQSEITVNVRYTYAFGIAESDLVLTESRTSRKAGPELRTILKRR
jgi:hypothetical protein